MARTIVSRDPTSDAHHVTVSGGDETLSILDDLSERIGDCGDLSADASAAHTALGGLPKLQKEVAAKLDAAIYSQSNVMSDAKKALRETTAVTGSGFQSREVEIALKQKKFTDAHVRSIRDRLGSDATTKARAEKVATRAAEELRSFGNACASKRDALLVPRMDYSIEEIMNQEAAKTMWRAKGADMLRELRDFYVRLIEREQEDDQIAIEPVIVALAAEVRDTPAHVLANKRNRQPTTTDEDRTVAYELLTRVDRMRAARLPEWLAVSEWMHAQLKGVFLLAAGHHARFSESFDTYMRRRASGAASDSLAIDPSWPFRLHGSSFDSKRAQ